MKILVVGDWHSKLHEEVVSHAFKKLGHEVLAFSWHQYFLAKSKYLTWFFYVFKRAQYKYMWGPVVRNLNKDLIDFVEKNKPEIVFVYRGTHILPATLRKIKENDVILVGYNNDDPFSPYHPHWAWRHFLKGIPEYDLMLAYRHHNIQDFQQAGAKRVELLRSWFVPEYNYAVELTAEEKKKFECDVVFIGHYEADQRVEYLEAIEAAGFKLRLFGPGYDWDPIIAKSTKLAKHIPVKVMFGNDYNLALNGAKIALCFLSKLNRDTYTRRCFEIPSTGTFMLAEYTQDLADLFIEGEQVEFFRSSKEMISKLTRYISDKAIRQEVAAAGYKRVIADGHDVASRMKLVLKWVNEIKES